MVRVIAASAICTTSASLSVWMVGGLAVLLRPELGFQEYQLGVVTGTYFMVSAMASVPAGQLSHHVGARRTSLVATAGAALALAVVASATSYVMLLGAMVIGGVSNALAQMGSNEFLARSVPFRRQGIAFGVKQSAIPASTLVAGIAVPTLGLTIGWRGCFAIAAVAAVAALFVVPRENYPRPTGRVQVRDGDVLLGGLLIVAVAAALGSAAANALGTFLVESAVASGVAPGYAGILLASGSIVGICFRLLVGWQADRRSGRHLAVVALMLSCGAAGVALLGSGSTATLIPGVALAFGLGWSWPGLLHFGVVAFSPVAPAVATSISQMGAFAGGAGGPVLFGLLVHGHSYAVAWWCTAAAMLLAASTLLIARRVISTRRQALGT